MDRSARRVAVTGIGMVTPLGNTSAATLAGLESGQCAIGPVTSFDASGWKETRAAEVAGFDPRPWFRVPKALKLADRRTRFAVAAAHMALDDANLSSGVSDSERFGVLIGSSGSDMQIEDLARAVGHDDNTAVAHDIERFGEKILAGLNPLWLLVNLPNMVSAHVAIQFGATGPNSTIMTDSIAGTQAIGEAASWIREGEADVVLAGGADTGVLPIVLSQYEQAGVLGNVSGSINDSFVLGEGAAILLLENYDHAIRRGARILGEIAGFSSAFVPAGERPSALASTMTDAFSESGAERIDRVFSSAAGREAEHRELEALESIFESSLTPIRLRYALGHALGASGAIDAAVALCGRRTTFETVLCNAAGLSGQAATLALRSGDNQ